MEKQELKDLLKSDLHAGQVVKLCNEKGIRLSVFGWSRYAVEDGVLLLHYHFGSEEYTEAVASVDELTFFDEEDAANFEYQQAITPAIVSGLRRIL